MEIFRRLFPFYLVTVCSLDPQGWVSNSPQFSAPSLLPTLALPLAKEREPGPLSFLSFAGLSLASFLRGELGYHCPEPLIQADRTAQSAVQSIWGQSRGVRPRAGCSPSHYFAERLNLWSKTCMRAPDQREILKTERGCSLFPSLLSNQSDFMRVKQNKAED